MMFTVSVETTLPSGRSDISCVEVLNALRELEQLRHREAMETALIEYSLGEKISGVYNSKTARTSEHRSLPRAHELSEAMADWEKERELCQRKYKAMVQSDKGLKRDVRLLCLKKDSNQIEQKSRGDCSAGKLSRGAGKGKQVLQAASDVNQLSKRLTIVEEENRYMKQVFLKTLHERRMLLNEIQQQFQEIHHWFHYRNKLTGDQFCDGSLVVDRTLQRGLSQVLCQESSPWVVTRHNTKNNIFRSYDDSSYFLGW